MYTEINEVVNFIARHMHFRIPRLKICLFAEHLANLMLLHYTENWDVMDPYKNKEIRVLRFSRSPRYDCSALPEDNLVFGAALSVGLTMEEISMVLPDRLVIFVNPGEVMYIIGDQISVTNTIYIGNPKTTDDNFTTGQHIPLSLVQPRELGLENPFPMIPHEFLMFRYIINQQNFTVESFSQTRFGSLRKRPDPEILRRLQKSIKLTVSP